MRELRFRAWNTARNCWTSRVELDGGWGKPMFMHGEIENDSGYQTDNTIIEQYTGLKDKNGKEIYEGDVLESTWNGDKAVVVWNDIEGEWEHYADFNTHSKYSGSVVIGNIHENPELLEEE